ncbi:MAG: hypothetical protein RMK29_21055 [Myxococcales bacterium]|nr:hypothetical protein [Myxococcota bacterium]MDW8284202.1 hypothetical protein [Myxococcales bacterium]
MTRTRRRLTPSRHELETPWEPEPLMVPLHLPEPPQEVRLDKGRDEGPRVIVIDLA